MGGLIVSDEAQLKLLPPRTRLLARRIGLPALTKLSRRYGGVTIYVPSKERLARSHWLARYIGWEESQALVEEEGYRLEVPFCLQAVTAALHAEIRAYRLAGNSERETALRFKISARWVRYLMSKSDPVPVPQQDLFGGAREGL